MCAHIKKNKQIVSVREDFNGRVDNGRDACVETEDALEAIVRLEVNDCAKDVDKPRSTCQCNSMKRGCQ